MIWVHATPVGARRLDDAGVAAYWGDVGSRRAVVNGPGFKVTVDRVRTDRPRDLE